jgi:hypothetical protein
LYLIDIKCLISFQLPVNGVRYLNIFFGIIKIANTSSQKIKLAVLYFPQDNFESPGLAPSRSYMACFLLSQCIQQGYRQKILAKWKCTSAQFFV